MGDVNESLILMELCDLESLSVTGAAAAANGIRPPVQRNSLTSLFCQK